MANPIGASREENQPSLPPPLWKLTGTSSYPSGGYDPPTNFADIGVAKGMALLDQNAGAAPFELRYNKTTSKFQVYRKLPTASMIVEEVVPITTSLGQLANVPAFIIALHVTAGGTTGAFKSIPGGLVPPTTKQVSVSFTTGALAFKVSDAVTSIKVTYIPMGVGPFIPANQVVDEAVVLANAGVNLANQASLVQYVYDATDAGFERPAIMNAAGTPATHQIAINLDNSTNTTLTSNAAQNTHAAKVTYWKRSAISSVLGYTAQANMAVTSNAIKLATVNAVNGLFIPTFGEAVVGLTVVPAYVEEILEGPSGTVAANVAVYNPALQKITFNAGDSIVNMEAALVVLDDALIAQTAEVGVGTSLTSATWRVAIFGTP